MFVPATAVLALCWAGGSPGAASVRASPARAGAARAGGGVMSAAAAEVSAAAAPSEIELGETVTLSGRVAAAAQPLAGAHLALESDPYPFRGYSVIARTTSAADGSFGFTRLAPDRDTRLRVLDEDAGGAFSAQVSVAVAPVITLGARTLGPGRTLLGVRVRHAAAGLPARPFEVRWYIVPRGQSRFRLAATSTSRELAAGLSHSGAIVNPPARSFVYRACMDPPWRAAMGAAGAGCAELGAEAQASGEPLGAYPSPRAVAEAGRYLASRAGRTAFAVVDSGGRLSGVRVREHFETASVVKVMMLIALTQLRAAQHRNLDDRDKGLLYPMIHESNNDAASAVLGIVGEGALERVARESHMRDYAPGVGWWAFTETSPADQARLLSMLDRLIPPRFDAYARWLMSTIEPQQSWGIPPVARPRWQVFFKTGQLPEEGIFNEVGRLERHGITIAIAVFTSGDPSMSYGQETIAGVAARLLTHAP
jgi:Beta-lactamase enzyme family